MNGIWSEMARSLRRKVKVAKFDVTTNHPDPIVQKVDIDGYPAIKFYGPGKKDEKGITYKGNRNAETMETWALKEKRRVLEGDEALLMDGSVHVLDANNFNSTVYGSEEPWFIEFYAPWCGHCKTLHPIWESTARELSGKIKMGKVNGDD
jgi:thiol:disulfide interchange protein